MYYNPDMLSIERVKQILKHRSLSDKEAEEIRDGFHELAKILLEQWQEELRTAEKLNKSEKIVYDGPKATNV
jgi:signal-transduction protein with cAMP-binding, CBS, and nucleotidyltransferase domain